MVNILCHVCTFNINNKLNTKSNENLLKYTLKIIQHILR